MNLADWVWKKVDDSVFAQRESDGTPEQSVASLRSSIRDVFRRINMNMKLLENSVNISGRYIAGTGTFANGATTPSVLQASVWKTNNSAPTTITNFVDGEAGRSFTLIAGDANTTIQNNANIVTRTGANRVLVNGETTLFVSYGGSIWQEVPAPQVASSGPSIGSYDPGTAAIATDKFLLQDKHLYLTATERMTLVGTAEVLLTDFGNTATVVLGSPKAPTLSFTVPTDFFLDQFFRLALAKQQRATLLGTADLILTDDFKTRSRIVLAN